MQSELVLNKYGKLIEEELLRRFSTLSSEAGTYHPYIENLYRVLQNYVLRKGKRISACSTLMVYEGYTGKVDAKIIKVACGVELYRHAILVHDDLVDKDEERRGGPTLHLMLDGERQGKGSAVFAGNILFSLAMDSFISAGVKDISNILNELSLGYKYVNESQILDLLFEHSTPTVSEWEVMASRRAASLFRLAMLTGAYLGKAPDKDISTLQEISEHIGYAFDIQDDIIDSFASYEQYGRAPGGDLYKGKRPLHIILGMRDSSLLDILSAPKINSLDVDECLRLIRESGAIDSAREISKEHSNRARTLLSTTEMSEEAKEFFISLLDYIEEDLEWYL
ncbi:MAG: polyprenyl synthetase family protein [Methermicoccaceae archaeon]